MTPPQRQTVGLHYCVIKIKVWGALISNGQRNCFMNRGFFNLGYSSIKLLCNTRGVVSYLQRGFINLGYSSIKVALQYPGEIRDEVVKSA